MTHDIFTQLALQAINHYFDRVSLISRHWSRRDRLTPLERGQLHLALTRMVGLTRKLAVWTLAGTGLLALFRPAEVWEIGGAGVVAAAFLLYWILLWRRRVRLGDVSSTALTQARVTETANASDRAERIYLFDDIPLYFRPGAEMQPEDLEETIDAQRQARRRRPPP